MDILQERKITLESKAELPEGKVSNKLVKRRQIKTVMMSRVLKKIREKGDNWSCVSRSCIIL